MKENDKFGLGLIGCGEFGTFCLEAFSELPEVRIAAVADLRADAARGCAERFGVPACRDSSELIARGDVDVIHVATPPADHHGQVLAAAEAGKNVLCEKPLALSLAQADQMLSAAAGAGTIAPVNFVLRYNAVTEAVKSAVECGAPL